MELKFQINFIVVYTSRAQVSRSPDKEAGVSKFIEISLLGIKYHEKFPYLGQKKL